MSYQYLTVKMFEKAKVNQTAFKTHEKYTFDSVLQVLDIYNKHIRPLCHPTCDFLVVTTNGTQYTTFSTAMSLLVFMNIILLCILYL